MKKWVCPVCGYVHEGDTPPEFCPQCKVPGSKFIEQKAEKSWAAEHVVDDAAALHAVQVGVWLCAGVEPLLPAEHADAHHVALFGKQAQVPVHRAEAQVGIVRLELLIQLLRGGVGGRRGEGFEDDLPLFAVFADGHRSTSFDISNRNYY